MNKSKSLCVLTHTQTINTPQINCIMYVIGCIIDEAKCSAYYYAFDFCARMCIDVRARMCIKVVPRHAIPPDCTDLASVRFSL